MHLITNGYIYEHKALSGMKILHFFFKIKFDLSSWLHQYFF
jgi:hypothetical protein